MDASPPKTDRGSIKSGDANGNGKEEESCVAREGADNTDDAEKGDENKSDCPANNESQDFPLKKAEDEASHDVDADANDTGSNDGNDSNAHEGEGNDSDLQSDDESSRPPQYPPLPPPGYMPYPPPPPGFYPYYPPMPLHPHHPYPYPPPPVLPGYYPPPSMGYYPPPPHPGHLIPPPIHTGGERDSQGNYIYGGPPLSTSSSVPAKRSRMRIKTSLDVTHRKERKNAQSRQRAARLRQKVESIKIKAEEEKLAEEDAKLYQTVEERRARKNNRSRERALEKKAEIERILAKPECERTKEELDCLEIANAAKKRKNEGDRLRRERLKSMGLKSKPPGVSILSRPRKPLLHGGENNILPYSAASPSPSSLVQLSEGAMGQMPPLHPPQILHHVPETFLYPPPAPHTHSYPLPNSYYAQPPPPPKEEEEGEEGSNIDVSMDNNEEEMNSNSRLDSTHTDPEISELML